MKSTKHLILIILALISLNVNAEEAVSLTINVETAGTLPDLIPSSQKYEITNLTLTGFLNGNDIRYIREMAGKDLEGVNTEGKLSVLDLSKAHIVAGGKPYYRSFNNDYYSSLNSIGEYAFQGCSGLTSVTIPNSVTTIGYSAFNYCNGLTSITIPDGVTSIGSGAFQFCSGLTSVTIPNSVTTIEVGAFYDCSGLTSITISNSVTTIGDYAFYDCSGLTSVTIPSNVTTIWNFAFSYCAGLTSVTLSESVTTIGEDAFDGCNQIKQIYCKGTTPPKTEFDPFSDVLHNTCVLYVPKGSYSVYQADPHWGKFTNIIEKVITSIPGIESSKMNVYSENGSIFVKGGKLGDTVDIYSVSGSLLHKIKITDNIVRISVAPHSLYIVKAGDRSFKIAL